MRFRRAGVTTAIALACALACGLTGALGGCVADTPTAITTPTPTVAPLFATEEEALAAATEAYAAYQRAVDDSLTRAVADELGSVATGDALLAAMDSVKSFKADGKRLVGDTAISRVKFVAPPASMDSGEDFNIYACLDVSSTSVVDSSGAVIVDNALQSAFPTYVVLQYDSIVGKFLVASEEVWDGVNFCS
jgi:hypothetical protein